MTDVFNSGKTFKRPFGAELRINGDDEEKSAKRPPIYALSLPSLSNYFDIILLRPSLAIHGLPPLGPGITFRPSRITLDECSVEKGLGK